MKCWYCKETEMKVEHEMCERCVKTHFKVKRYEEDILKRFKANYDFLVGKKAAYNIGNNSYRINTYIKENVKDTIPKLATCVMYVKNQKFTLTSMKIRTRKKFHMTGGQYSNFGENVEKFNLPTTENNVSYIQEIAELTNYKQELLREKILSIFERYINENIKVDVTN